MPAPRTATPSQPVRMLEFAPDTDPTAPGNLQGSFGYYVVEKGLRAFPGLRVLGVGLPSQCFGAFSGVLLTLPTATVLTPPVTPILVGATAQGLYLADVNGNLRPSALGFTNTINRWRFAAYGQDLIAVNGVDPNQFYRLSAGVWAPLPNGADGTTCPIASIVESTDYAIILVPPNSYSFLSSLSDSPPSWAGSVPNQVYIQPIQQTEGPITAVHRLRNTAIFYKATSSFVGYFNGGTIGWDVQEISLQIGAPNQEVVINTGDYHYFYDGFFKFWQFDGWNQTELPNHLIEWFRRDMNPAAVGVMAGQFDASRDLLIWYYSSKFAVSNQPPAPPPLPPIPTMAFGSISDFNTGLNFYSSKDSITWGVQNNNLISGNSIDFEMLGLGGGACLALSQGICRSTDDGGSWSAIAESGFQFANSFQSGSATSGTTIVAIGNQTVSGRLQGFAVVSTDGGVTWTPYRINPDNTTPHDCASIAYSPTNGLFVTADSKGIIYSSSNGQAWTARITLVDNSPMWAATTAFSLTQTIVATATDGNRYIFEAIVPGTSGGMRPTWPTSGIVADGSGMTQITWQNNGPVEYGANNFVWNGAYFLGMVQATIPSSNLNWYGMVKSFDGVSWTQTDGGVATTGLAGPPLTWASDLNLWLCCVQSVSEAPTTLTAGPYWSSDGLTWTLGAGLDVVSPKAVVGVCRAPFKVGNVYYYFDELDSGEPNGVVFTTSDGQTYTLLQESPTYSWLDAEAGPDGMIVALGAAEPGGIYSHTYIVTSPDGETWTQRQQDDGLFLLRAGTGFSTPPPPPPPPPPNPILQYPLDSRLIFNRRQQRWTAERLSADLPIPNLYQAPKTGLTYAGYFAGDHAPRIYDDAITPGQAYIISNLFGDYHWIYELSRVRPGFGPSAYPDYATITALNQNRGGQIPWVGPTEVLSDDGWFNLKNAARLQSYQITTRGFCEIIELEPILVPAGEV